MDKYGSVASAIPIGLFGGVGAWTNQNGEESCHCFSPVLIIIFPLMSVDSNEGGVKKERVSHRVRRSTERALQSFAATPLYKHFELTL